MKRLLLLLVTLLTVGLLTACGSSSSGPEVKVVMGDMIFTPDTLEISKGSTVTWVNEDSVDHAVSDRAGSFKSPSVPAGKSYSHQFDKAGTYKIICWVAGHDTAGMVMEVKVK